jgi:hypothetical protein
MKAARWLASPLLSAVGILKKPKKAEAPAALPPVTRDSVREGADRRDALRRRRGGAADIVTGAYGAEPVMPTGKETLGS